MIGQLFKALKSSLPPKRGFEQITRPMYCDVRDFEQITRPMYRDAMFSFNFMAEIEDEIFQWAAIMFPADAPSFCIISKRVRPLVEAIMYKTIVFISNDEFFRQTSLTIAERFETTLRARPAEFFAARVRNVCITSSVTKNITTLILTKCTGIRNLAIWQYLDLTKLDVGKSIGPLSSSLCSLSAGRYTLRQLADSGYVFPSLKYLAVGMLPLDIHLPTLEWLPALSSVRLRLGQQPVVDDQWSRDVRIVISTVPELQTLWLDVNRLCIDDVSKQVAELNEERIVVRDEDILPDPIVEWRNTWI